jgi:hypothetical protein
MKAPGIKIKKINNITTEKPVNNIADCSLIMRERDNRGRIISGES